MAVSARAGERSEPRFAGVLGAAIAVALLAAAAFSFPQVGLLALLCPFPIVLQRIRGGAGAGAMTGMVSAALLGAALPPALAVYFLLFAAGPALLMGEAVARGRGLVRGCAWAFAFLAALIGLHLLFAHTQMAAFAVRPFEVVIEDLRTSGLPAEKIDNLTEQAGMMRRIFAVVYPAAYIILAAMGVLVNATLVRAYLIRRDPGWLEDGEFESARLPLGLSVVFVLAGLGVLMPPFRPAAYNLLLVLAFFFALQGLAVVGYYTHRLAAPPFLRMAVMVLVLINPWAPQILSLMGLFDLWFDFRKWAEPPEAESGP